MADETQTRVDSGIVEMWRTNGWLYGLVGVVLGLALGVIILPAIGALENGDDVRAFLNDLAPELIGILITVFVIDRLNRRRDERNAEAALKRQLKIDAASLSNEKAKDAVHQLRRKNWLFDFDMENADLRFANLQDADLSDAHLCDVDFFMANLQRTNLTSANLQNASLLGANLRKADLHYSHMPHANLLKANLQQTNLFRAYLQMANLRESSLCDANLHETNLERAELQDASLQRAKLIGTNLRYANLSKANLEAADLRWANLRYANLENVVMNESTRLPDESYWTKETILERFTDSDRSDFWRSPLWVTPDEYKEYK